MKHLKTLTFILLSVVVSGCQSTSSLEKETKHYLTSEPLCLKADRILMESFLMKREGEKAGFYKPLMALESDLKAWAASRFKACGGAPSARLSFPKASLTQRTEPSKELFRRGRDLFSISVTAQVEILDEHGFPVSLVHASVDHETSLSEGLTLNEREEKLEDFKTKILNDLDREVTRQVRQNLSRHVKERG